MLKIKDLKVGDVLIDFAENELEIVYIFNDYLSILFNGKELVTINIDDLNATCCKLKQPEPERIQGFAIGEYDDVPVWVTDNSVDWYIGRLSCVGIYHSPFKCRDNSIWKYAKPLTADDIVVPNYKL